MQAENRKRLEALRHHYIRWTKDCEVNISAPDKQLIVDVIRQEWDPNYRADLWCGRCVGKMIEYAFNQMDVDKTDTEIVKIKF